VDVLEELKRILSFVFNIKGKKTLLTEDFINIVSYDLHWFSPTEAGQLLTLCKELNLITTENNEAVPTFDVSKIETAVDFKPDKNVLAYKSRRNVFMNIVEKISKDTKINESDVVSEINKIKAEFPATNEAIALLVARRHNVGINEFFDIVENEIKKM